METPDEVPPEDDEQLRNILYDPYYKDYYQPDPYNSLP